MQERFFTLFEKLSEAYKTVNHQMAQLRSFLEQQHTAAILNILPPDIKNEPAPEANNEQLKSFQELAKTAKGVMESNNLDNIQKILALNEVTYLMAKTMYDLYRRPGGNGLKNYLLRDDPTLFKLFTEFSHYSRTLEDFSAFKEKRTSRNNNLFDPLKDWPGNTESSVMSMILAAAVNEYEACPQTEKKDKYDKILDIINFSILSEKDLSHPAIASIPLPPQIYLSSGHVRNYKLEDFQKIVPTLGETIVDKLYLKQIFIQKIAQADALFKTQLDVQLTAAIKQLDDAKAYTNTGNLETVLSMFKDYITLEDDDKISDLDDKKVTRTESLPSDERRFNPEEAENDDIKASPATSDIKASRPSLAPDGLGVTLSAPVVPARRTPQDIIGELDDLIGRHQARWKSGVNDLKDLRSCIDYREIAYWIAQIKETFNGLVTKLTPKDGQESRHQKLIDQLNSIINRLEILETDLASPLYRDSKKRAHVSEAPQDTAIRPSGLVSSSNPFSISSTISVSESSQQDNKKLLSSQQISEAKLLQTPVSFFGPSSTVSVPKPATPEPTSQAPSLARDDNTDDSDLQEPSQSEVSALRKRSSATISPGN